MRRNNSASHQRSSVVASSVRASARTVQPSLWPRCLAEGLRQQAEIMRLSHLDSHVLMHCQALLDVVHAGGSISLHRHRPPQEDAPLPSAVRQSLRGGEGHQCVGTGMGGCGLPEALGKHRENIFRIRDTRGMLGLPGQGQGVLAALPGLVRIAQGPQGSHQPDEVGNPGVEPTGKNGGGGQLGSGELEALLEVGPGGDEITTIRATTPTADAPRTPGPDRAGRAPDPRAAGRMFERGLTVLGWHETSSSLRAPRSGGASLQAVGRARGPGCTPVLPLEPPCPSLPSTAPPG